MARLEGVIGPKPDPAAPSLPTRVSHLLALGQVSPEYMREVWRLACEWAPELRVKGKKGRKQNGKVTTGVINFVIGALMAMEDPNGPKEEAEAG